MSAPGTRNDVSGKTGEGEVCGRRVEDLEAITRVGAAIASAMDVDSLCRLAGESILAIFSTSVVFIALHDVEEGLIHTPFFAMDGEVRAYPPFRFGQGLSSEVIRSRKPLHFDTLEENLEARRQSVSRSERVTKSWLGVPMMAGNEVLGVLSVQSFEAEHAFDGDDIVLLSTIASYLAARIQGARLLEEVSRRAAEAAAVAEAGRWISQSLDLDTVLLRISERAADLLTKGEAAVFLLEGGFLLPVAARGPQAALVAKEVIPAEEGILGRVLRNGRAEFVNDTYSDPDAVTIPGSPPDEIGEKLMAAPLMGGESAIGVMAIWRQPGEPPFLKADLDFLVSLARQAEVAIQNARLHLGVKEANRLKSRFLASMSHELRTPLNSIINFAWLLLQGSEGDLSEGQADFLGRIQEAGESLLGLINDILDLSKIESGRMELRFEELDFRELAKGVLQTTTGLIHDRPIELVRDLPEDLPPLVADRTRLRQILLNLLSNAAKFTEKGRITLSARAEGRDFVFRVEDTGIGMAAADIPRAFEEFVQLGSGEDGSIRGTGLGLPLARDLVELHGGSIAVDSSPGRGSRFTVRLPRERRISPAATPAFAPSHAPAPAPRGTDRPGPEGDAGRAGADDRTFRVEPLAEPTRALEKARSLKPDLVLLDIMMPGMDGWEVLKAFKADSELRDVPVVMCTALNEQGMARSLGAADYLAKPLDLGGLRSLVGNLLPGGGTILVIDDDSNARALVERAFRLEGREDGDARQVR